MVLLGELLRTQLVHLGHLTGQSLTGLKTLRVEDHLEEGGGGRREWKQEGEKRKSVIWSPTTNDHSTVTHPQPPSYLSDQGIVGHHHGYGSEQGFEVVRELSASSVAWVHSDEGSTCHHQLDLSALKHEPGQLQDRDHMTGGLNQVVSIYHLVFFGRVHITLTTGTDYSVS